MTNAQIFFTVSWVIGLILIVLYYAPKDKPPFPGNNDPKSEKTFGQILSEDLGMNGIKVNPRPKKTTIRSGSEIIRTPGPASNAPIAVAKSSEPTEINFAPVIPMPIKRYSGCASGSCSDGFRAQ